MLQSQINYLNYLETKRHNKIGESQNQEVVNQGWDNVKVNKKNAETNYLNWQVNSRNADTNKENAITNRQNADTNRLNYYVNVENMKINSRNADINQQNANTNAYNAGVNAYNAQTNRLNWYTNQQNADTNTKNQLVNAKNADTNRVNAFTNRINADVNKRNTEYDNAIGKQKYEMGKVDVKYKEADKILGLAETGSNVAQKLTNAAENLQQANYYGARTAETAVDTATKVLDVPWRTVNNSIGAVQNMKQTVFGKSTIDLNKLKKGIR